LLCTEDDNSCYRNVCKMSVVSFALAVVFIISTPNDIISKFGNLENKKLYILVTQF